MPLDEEGVPLSNIYGQVLIEQNVEAMRKTRKPDEMSGSKLLNTIQDMFYIKKIIKKSKISVLAKRIILTGEAGYGKTVLCLKLVDTWSKSKQNKKGQSIIKQHSASDTEHKVEQSVHAEDVHGLTSIKDLDKSNNGGDKGSDDYDNDDNLQQFLAYFDMVFYIPLRHAKHGISSIVDLVCESVQECEQNTKQKLRQMLGDGKIPCLVILDGLDEWKAPDTCRVPGFPDIDGLVNYTVLCTMRPWRMVNLCLALDSLCDKAVQILGLKDASVETVISNVLVHYYGLQLDSPLYEEKFKHFCAQAKLPELKSLMKIPLMLTASCLVWNEESDVSSSYFMSLFYLKLMVLTITRAENKHGIVNSFLNQKRQNTNTLSNIPSILLEFDPIIDSLEIIKPVGRLALHDLLSKEPHLVFPKNKLERDIGKSNVEIALKVGILSQSKAPGLSYQQRVSVSFYHKSFQEFTAALYMACGDVEALASFCSKCNTMEKIMELSNIIKFVFGLDTVVSSQLSEHINDVVSHEVDIMQYRRKRENMYNLLGRDHKRDNDEVARKYERVYMEQYEWLNETAHNLHYTHNTDYKVNHVLKDLYLDGNSKIGSVASKLVSMKDNNIASVYLDCVDYWTDGIRSIIQYLPGCKYLTSLYVVMNHDPYKEVGQMLAYVLPKLFGLQHVTYGFFIPNEQKEATIRVHAADLILVSLYQCTQLKYIQLEGIELTNTVVLAHMPLLETIVLNYVPSYHFILSSVCQCDQLKNIELIDITLTAVVPQLERVREIEAMESGTCRVHPSITT